VRITRTKQTEGDHEEGDHKETYDNDKRRSITRRRITRRGTTRTNGGVSRGEESRGGESRVETETIITDRDQVQERIRTDRNNKDNAQNEKKWQGAEYAPSGSVTFTSEIYFKN
jgi:hypothetical protein